MSVPSTELSAIVSAPVAAIVASPERATDSKSVPSASKKFPAVAVAVLTSERLVNDPAVALVHSGAVAPAFTDNICPAVPTPSWIQSVPS